MEFLNANILYWHWMVLGLILMGLEILVPSFFLLWVGASAIIVGIVAAVVPLSVTLQLALWGGLSLVNLVLWFKWIQPKMQDRTRSGMTREAVLGLQGLVLEYRLESNQGRMRFATPVAGSDEWSIRSADALVAGDRVTVIDFSGNALIVKKNGTSSNP